HLHDLRNGRSFLPDGAIDTDEIVALVIDDGIEGHSGLACLAVADDKFALAPTDGNHGVDGFDAGRHRLTHRLAINYARRKALNRNKLIGGDGPFIVNGLSKGIYDPAYHRVPDGHGHDASGALHLSTFFDFGVVAEHHSTHLVFLQVHGDSGKTMAEVKQ